MGFMREDVGIDSWRRRSTAKAQAHTQAQAQAQAQAHVTVTMVAANPPRYRED